MKFDNHTNALGGGEKGSAIHELRRVASEFEEKFKQHLNDQPPVEFLRVYIPCLRGFRPLAASGNPYQSRTIQDYFPGLEQNSRQIVFTGYEMKEIVLDHLTGSLEERESIKDFEQTLSVQFFENQPIALIPRKERRPYI